MILYLLAYLGGVLTIVSPCILPVIPFVLARADRPFLRNGLPMLIGMSLAFAVVATLASVAGGWVVSANQYGRAAALILLAVFGVTLVFPGLADRSMRPLVAVGARSRNRRSSRARRALSHRSCSELPRAFSGRPVRVRCSA
jgi:cytochrome c biogenesis protein CcdA